MLSYVSIGWDNLMGLVTGKKGIEEVITPSKQEIEKQVMAAGSSGGAVPIAEIGSGGAKQLLDAAGLDFGKYAKYAKYALLGGAAVLAYSAIKK